MWRYVDPILSSWNENKVPLSCYAPGTNEASENTSWNEEPSSFRKEICLVGLGKMGQNMAQRLIRKGWKVTGTDVSETSRQELRREGGGPVSSLKELAQAMTSPRLVWLMVPPGKAVDEVLFGKGGLASLLKKGDTVIDGGNSFYKDSVRRHKKLAKKGIRFIDVGVSGGPQGALHGSCLMIGGKREWFEELEPLFSDLAQEQGYAFFKGPGAGHFVKMVHNGIEYGMMQAIAEGFSLLKKGSYKIDLSEASRVYGNGSVIESRLIDWLHEAFSLHGEDLSKISGRVGHTGMGKWTVDTAREMKVKAKVIEEALRFRKRSAEDPQYTGRILSALRERFGEHEARKRVDNRKKTE